MDLIRNLKMAAIVWGLCTQLYGGNEHFVVMNKEKSTEKY